MDYDNQFSEIRTQHPIYSEQQYRNLFLRSTEIANDLNNIALSFYPDSYICIKHNFMGATLVVKGKTKKRIYVPITNKVSQRMQILNFLFSSAFQGANLKVAYEDRHYLIRILYPLNQMDKKSYLFDIADESYSTDAIIKIIKTME